MRIFEDINRIAVLHRKWMEIATFLLMAAGECSCIKAGNTKRV
jgi:hypothetical protein